MSDAARELLVDSFGRIIEHAENIADDLSPDVANRRIVPDANTITWLLWHSARVIAAQLAPLAGTDEVWTARGWYDRFALDLPAESTGYGHTRADAAKVRGSDALLIGYFRDVHEAAITYVSAVTDEELARIIDTSWDPPVTVAARLVSIVDDCAQHLGAAGYLKGALDPSDLR